MRSIFNFLSFFPFNRTSEKHLCFPICSGLSAILLCTRGLTLSSHTVAIPNYQQSSQVCTSLHSNILNKWPYSKSQKIQGRISSTWLPQPQIIAICLISITISLVSETIQIVSCPNWKSSPALRILLPSVTQETLSRPLLHVFLYFQSVLLFFL